MITFYLIMAFVGAAFGSFLNVCIYRIPDGKSILFPRSKCPSCDQTIRFYHNIPVLSYLFLKGKCAYCGARISIQYPIIEFISILLSLIVFNKFGLSANTVFYLWLFYGIVVISAIDLRTRLILNKVLAVLLIGGVALNFVSHSISWKEAGIGLLSGGGSLYLIAVIGQLIFKKESMGMGDVKFAAVLGFFLGWKIVLLALYFGFFFSAVYYIIQKM